MQIALPDIGDYRDVPVIELLVKPGDRLAVDDLILSIDSDKATMEVPSPVAGTVRALLVAVGSKVSEGTPILLVEPADAPPPPPAAERGGPQSASGEAQPDSAGFGSGHHGAGQGAGPLSRAGGGDRRAPAEPSNDDPRPLAQGNVHASPSVRQLARELGITLDQVPATGPKGRILREDLHGFVKAALRAPAPAPEAPSGIGAGLPPWPAE